MTTRQNELMKEHEELKRKIMKEYQTFGNTKKCQEMSERYYAIEDELKGQGVKVS